MKKRTTNGHSYRVLYVEDGLYPLVVLGKITLNRDKVG